MYGGLNKTQGLTSYKLGNASSVICIHFQDIQHTVHVKCQEHVDYRYMYMYNVPLNTESRSSSNSLLPLGLC